MSNKLKILFIFAISVFAVVAIFLYRNFIPSKRVTVVPRAEINITIIPGWNLRQIAADWVDKKIIKSPDEFYALVGKPAYNYKANKELAPKLFSFATSSWDYFFKDKSNYLSYEGYFLPDTYRVYADAKPEEIFKKVFANLDEKITPDMREEITKQNKSFNEILTMASVVEKEAPTSESMGIVADIFWRRYQKNWALQSCATVNYITGKNDPAISAQDRAADSLFNTYKYPGLPLGPISNPGLIAIKAVIYPIKNDYWYFMSGTDGVMHYAKTLEEHNRNVYKFLR